MSTFRLGAVALSLAFAAALAGCSSAPPPPPPPEQLVDDVNAAMRELETFRFEIEATTTSPLQGSNRVRTSGEFDSGRLRSTSGSVGLAPAWSGETILIDGRMYQRGSFPGPEDAGWQTTEVPSQDPLAIAQLPDDLRGLEVVEEVDQGTPVWSLSGSAPIDVAEVEGVSFSIDPAADYTVVIEPGTSRLVQVHMVMDYGTVTIDRGPGPAISGRQNQQTVRRFYDYNGDDITVTVPPNVTPAPAGEST